jgi:hypothetical protein
MTAALAGDVEAVSHSMIFRAARERPVSHCGRGQASGIYPRLAKPT